MGVAAVRVQYVSSENLPDDVAAALVQGAQSCSILMNAHASVCEVAEALQSIVPRWVAQEWLHVGDVTETGRQLRAL